LRLDCLGEVGKASASQDRLILNNMNELKNLKLKVLHCLAQDEKSRNSDIRLFNNILLIFYKEFIKTVDGKDSVELSDLYQLPHQDNVKRIRAKIQNEDKKFLPTSIEVAKKRGWLEEDWRKLLGYNPELRTTNAEEHIEIIENKSFIQQHQYTQNKLFNTIQHYD